MQLKRQYGSKEEIPEGYENLYAEDDNGNWVIQVEGLVPREKVDEFRNNNIDLQKKLQELEGKATLDDDELEEYKELKKQQQENKDKQLIDQGKIDELVNQRTERMRKEADSQIKKLQEHNEKMEKQLGNTTGRLKKVLVETEAGKQISEAAVPRKGAWNDIVGRANSIWDVEFDDNGEARLVAKDSAGNPIYGADGKAPLTMQEWASDLTKNAEHLFEESHGGGGRGSSNSGDGGGDGGDKNVRQIPSTDQEAINSSLEDIASGKAVVVDNE